MGRITPDEHTQVGDIKRSIHSIHSIRFGDGAGIELPQLESKPAIAENECAQQMFWRSDLHRGIVLSQRVFGTEGNVQETITCLVNFVKF